MIPVQNIYYMLSYSFQVLNEQGYKKVGTEEFQNVGELCAAILTRGVSSLLKRGIGREYLETTEPLSTLKGRIEITESIKTQSLHRNQIYCTYDEFSVNSYLNRIIKTTMLALIHADIAKQRKKDLKKLLVFFADVDELDRHTINWRLQYNRNNQTYQMLIAICYLVMKGLLQTQSDGTTKLMDFLDEQRMSRLYEKFLLEYYRKEHKELKAEASKIDWIVDDDMIDQLPQMKTDITLSQQDKILIIDAKYYSHTMQEQFGAHTVHSGNLYQIFTYVKNKEAELKEQPHEVSGMLLYAKTDEMTHPDNVYHMSGNKISVKTLDLNQDFGHITSGLDGKVKEHFGKEYSLP